MDWKTSKAKWLSERTGIPTVALPFIMGGAAGACGLFSLFDLPSGAVIIWVMAGLGIAVWAGHGAVRAVPQTQR